MVNFNKEEFEANCIRWFTNPEESLSVCKLTCQLGEVKLQQYIERRQKEGWVSITKEEALSFNAQRRAIYRTAGLITENIGDIVFIRNVPNPETATPEIVNAYTYGPHGMTFKKKKNTSFDYKGAKVEIKDIQFFPKIQHTFNEFMYFVACNKIGAPQATEFMSVDDYKQLDYVGIYREIIN